MATRFEIVLCGENVVALRAAGEEALGEITRLEAQLSLFVPTSEIARVNARAAYQSVRVTPPVFGLLKHAQVLTAETEGAFDITIAPLMRCWGFLGGPGHLPDPGELAKARECVGMGQVYLDEESCAVRFKRPGVMLDLGAIGKGYAIDCAVELLREAGVESALIHGGTSTAYGIGQPPDADSWKIEIPSPKTMDKRRDAKIGFARIAAESNTGEEPPAGSSTNSPAPFAVVGLKNSSLSVSAVWGKFFQSGERNLGHIIDPRSGEPADRAILSAVALPSATESDALSTALLTVGPEGHDNIASLRAEIKTLVANERGGAMDIRSKGIQVEGA